MSDERIPAPATVLLTIRTPSAEKEVVAQVYGDAPGLAIHRGDDDAYSITHARSGLRVMGGILPIEKAHEAAVELARRADWTRPAEELRADHARLKPIRDAIARWSGAKIPLTPQVGRVAPYGAAPDLDANLKALAELAERKEREG